MAITNVKINGNNVNFKYGLTITELLNQDLDTGILVIPSSEKLDIEPFDLIEIQYEVINTRKFYVGTINEKIVNFQGTKEYQYEISFVSLAIKLQRIILPNKTITQSLDGTQDKTIKTIMQEYLSVYAPSLTLSTPLIQKLGSTIAPEQQWSKPTLFEVFNDLLKPLGSVVTMTDVNIISYLDLDEEGNTIDESFINNQETSQDISQYASAIEVDASNVYDRNAITRTPERYIVRTSQQGVLNSDNQEIILNKPIFEIKKVIAHLSYIDINSIWQKEEIDITDRVVNKKVYDLLRTTTQTGKIQDTSIIKYQRNYIYYEEGSNVIKGLSWLEDDWLPISTASQFAIDNVLYWSAFEQYGSTLANALSGVFNDFTHQQLSFDVEYTTTDNVLFRVRKDIQPRNQSILINSQTNANVYAQALGKQQQEFVNRIGNKEMIITGRYNQYGDIPQLKDKIDNFVLTKREIQFNGSHYNFKGTLSENYSADNMFASINTAKRYTELASPNQATISNHLNEFTYVISKVDEGHTTNKSLMENYIFETYGILNKHIQGAVVQTMLDETTGTTSKELLLETTPYQIGNSFVITMRFENNVNSHLQINDTYQFLNNQQQQAYLNYVDENGRFDRIAIRLYRYDFIPNNRGMWVQAYDYQPQNVDLFYTFKEGASASKYFPELKPSYEINDGGSITTYDIVNENAKVFAFEDTGLIINGGFEDYIKRYKDNREITQETLQFTILGSDDIFIKEKFYEYLAPVYSGTSSRPFRIAYSTSEVYNIRDKVYKGTLLPVNAAEISTSGNQLSIIDTTPFTTWSQVQSNVASYAICDTSGNILVAINGVYSPLYINQQ